MSPEPKPRSMAAVTITVNRKGATALWPLSNLAKCWNIRVSLSTSHKEVTTCGVRTISRKDHELSSKLTRGILRGHTPDLLEREDEMVRSVWRHTERGKTEMTTPQLFGAE